MKRDGRLDLALSSWVPDPITGYYQSANQKIAPLAPPKNCLSPSHRPLPLLLSPHSHSPKPCRLPIPKNLFKKMKKPSAQAPSPPPLPPPIFQSPILSNAFATFDSLSAAIAEASAFFDLATLLRSFCDANASALTPSPLPSPPQKFSQKKEETFRLCPLSPPPIFQSPILFDAFATFDSLSATTAEAGASLDLATLGCIAEESN